MQISVDVHHLKRIPACFVSTFPLQPSSGKNVNVTQVKYHNLMGRLSEMFVEVEQLSLCFQDDEPFGCENTMISVFVVWFNSFILWDVKKDTSRTAVLSKDLELLRLFD